MKDILTGLRFSPDTPPEKCSAATKTMLMRLFDNGAVTYSQFLYPYADSLLLSEDGDAGQYFFGTHSLLWNIAPETVEELLDTDLPHETVQVGCSAADITEFLDISGFDCGEMLLGSFDELLIGSVRPWSIREQSRKFCSFAEHIARMKGCSVHGTVGGYLAVSAENTGREEFARLYEAKTGRIMKEWIKQ